MIYVAVPFLLLGLTMMVRGSVYDLRPDSKMTEKRKRRNLKVGFTTDMKIFGHKVRRTGFIVFLVGAGIMGWNFAGSNGVPAPPAAVESP